MKRLAALTGSLLLALTISSCGAATGPVGTWGEGYNTDKQPYLELSLGSDKTAEYEQAGFLAGSDGCNRITGQWFLVQGKLSFSQLSGTQMACEGVDPWLMKAAGGEIDGDVLTVMDSAGLPVGTLDRRN